MTDRKWWPEDLIDEVIPPGRNSPSDWLRLADGAVVIRDDDDPDSSWQLTVSSGDVVDFTYCDQCGRAVVAFRRDGTYEARSPIPVDWSHLWPIGWTDPEMMAVGLTELAGLLHDMVDDTDEFEVAFCFWSDAQPHRIDVVDGKPIAVPVATGHA